MEIHRYLAEARERHSILARGGVILRTVVFVMLLAQFILSLNACARIKLFLYERVIRDG